MFCTFLDCSRVCMSVPKECVSVIRNPSAKHCDWLSHARPVPFPFPLFLFNSTLYTFPIDAFVKVTSLLALCTFLREKGHFPSEMFSKKTFGNAISSVVFFFQSIIFSKKNFPHWNFPNGIFSIDTFRTVFSQRCRLRNTFPKACLWKVTLKKLENI